MDYVVRKDSSEQVPATLLPELQVCDILHPLSDETNRPRASRILGPHVSRLSESPLESAIAYVGANARTTGEEPFELRRKAAHIQRDAVVRWAQASGLMLDPSLWQGRAVLSDGSATTCLKLRLLK